MAHLKIDFTKYQIYFDIIPTSAENFIRITLSGPPIQPPRLPEVKFKIYIPSGHSFTLSALILFGLFENNGFINCVHFLRTFLWFDN